MSAFQFRFSRPFSFRNAGATAFAAGFAPRKPRHPLLRLLLGLLGLAVLLVLVFFSVFVGVAMLAVGLVFRLWKRRTTPNAGDGSVVDGEFQVVRKTALPSA